MDFDDLKYSLDSGNIFADTASFMCRDEDESARSERAWAGRAPKMVTGRPRQRKAPPKRGTEGLRTPIA
jgi:hypothetical protein